MQRLIAMISDIHANFEALSAVLADVEAQNVQDVVCLGGWKAGANWFWPMDSQKKLRKPRVVRA